MQSSRGPGQFSVAPDPDPGQATSADLPPRRELIVEEWVPERPSSSLGKKVTATRQPTSRAANALTSAAAAGVVVALHLGIGVWLLTSTGSQSHAPAADPLVLLPLSTRPSSRLAPSEFDAELPHPDLVRVTPILPPMPHLAESPAEIAVPISASSEVLISEVRGDDVAELAVSCRRPGARPHGPRACTTCLSFPRLGSRRSLQRGTRRQVSAAGPGRGARRLSA